MAMAQNVTATVGVGNSPAAVAVNPVTSTIYVVNTASNTVSVINGTTNSLTATVTTGSNPVALAVNPVSNMVYVANNGSSNITVIDGATNTTSTITDPNAISPVAVALNPITNMVYVANIESNNLSVINGAGNTLAGSVGVGNLPTSVVVNPATNMVYVANRASNNVTVVNGSNNTVAATIGTGTNPVSLTVDTATNMVYAANNGSNSLTVIKGASNTVAATVGTGTNPAAVTVNPVTDIIYVANNGSSNVTVINGVNNTVTATVTTGNSPIAVAADQTTDQIYVVNNASNNVTAIDGVSNAVATVADTSAIAPVAVAVDPVTNTVYTANNGSANVTVIDADSNLVTTTLTTSTNPIAVALNTVTNKIYVVDSASSAVTVIDGSTNLVVATVNTGTNPVAIAVNTASNMVYVANKGNNTVTVIDGTNNSVVATLPTGTNPIALAVNPVTNTVYAANNGSGNVTVINGANNSITTTVSAGTAPVAIAANPATGLVYVANNGSDNITMFDPVVSSDVTITDLAASRPIALAVDSLTNRIYVANAFSDNVSVIDGATATVIATVNAGDTPSALALNATTNRIYVSNSGNGTVTVIDGTTLATIAAVQVGMVPSAVSVNPTLNRIYVANNGNDSTDFGSVTVIDGSSNATTTVVDTNANEPSALAANPVTGEVYVANRLTSNVSVITTARIRPNPIATAIAPLVGNQTSDETPTFNFTASNGLSTAPVDELLFQMDTWLGSWTPATPTTHGNFTGTTATLLPGFHTIFAYATEGEEATSTVSGAQSSPLIGTIAAYGFLVATPLADIAPPSLGFGNQRVGTQSSPQTVTLGNPGSSPLMFTYAVAPGDFFEGPGDTCSSAGGQLAPNSSCTVSVIFKPSTPGNENSTVTFTDNANNIPGSTQTVTLTGTGTTMSFALNVAEGGTGGGTVTSNPAGINCPTTRCAANFSAGTGVMLTATPNAGSTFVGWSGACSGRGTCTVVMNSNQAVTATFKLISPTSCTGTTTNWIGGPSGNWSSASNWSTDEVPNGTNVNVCINDGNPSPSQVTLDINVSVGALYIDSGSSLTISDGQTLVAAGNISNAGQIVVNETGGHNTFLSIGGAVNLTGGGTVTLNTAQAGGTAIINQSGGQTLTNVNNTLQGTGVIGSDGLSVINQAGGIINANATGTLVVNTGAFSNQGLLEATSGLLQLQNNYNNSGGRILSSGSGAIVQLVSATVQGGTLTSANGGTLGVPSGTSVLDGSSQGILTIAGSYTVADGSTTLLKGTINNTGTILLNETAGHNTFLSVGAAVSLTGGGTVTLNSGQAGGTAIVNQSGGQILTNVNNTLQGTGVIGSNGLSVINQAGGTVNANVSSATNPLVLNAGPFTNQGVLEATNGGLLQLEDNFNNAGGKTLSSGSGSNVQLIGATVQGGMLTSASSGALGTAGGTTVTLDGSSQGTLTLAGTYAGSDGSTTLLKGTINNTGTVQLNEAGHNTFLSMAGPVSLTGAGTVTLNTTQVGGTAIINQSGSQTLTNVNNTLQGAGIIGSDGLTVVNQGTINANSPTQGALVVNANAPINEGLMEATAGATLQLNGDTVNNTGGTILASGTGSTVQFANGVTIQSGTVSTSGGGSLGALGGNGLTLDGATHGPLTITGTYTGADGSTTLVKGAINNTGTILLNETGGHNTFLSIGGPVSLTGNGIVSLNTASPGGTAIINQSGNQTLTNVDNTLQGTGIIGSDGLSVINAGTIDANVSGSGSLTLNPGGFTNQGLLEATGGGTLILSSSTIVNGTGTIQVSGATSTVQLVAGATIEGGSVASTNGGLLTIPGGNTITLDGSTGQGPLTIAGTYVGADGSTTVLKGAINNTGTILLNETGGHNTFLSMAAPVNLTGAGTVTLNTAAAGGTAIINQAGSQTLTNVNNSLQGTGVIGSDGLSVINQGTINASVAGSLTLNPGGFTNQGVLEATGGGTLVLSSSTIANGTGSINVNGATSSVQFVSGAVIQGGKLTTANNGSLTIPGGNTITLDGSTNQGTLTIAGNYVGSDGSTTVLKGNINNTGTILLNETGGHNTFLSMAAPVSLMGAGTVTLNTAAAGGTAIINQAGTQTLTNVNNLLQGTGVIGSNGLSVTNQGTINANVAGSLTLNPGGFMNQGVLEASAGGTLVLSSSTLSNGAGAIEVNGASSSVQFVNGATIQGGTLATANNGILTIPGGNSITLDGSTSQGALTLAGTYVGTDGSTTLLKGTINNTGTIQLNEAGHNTFLSIAAPVSLTGNGTVTLNTTQAGGTAIINQSGNQTLTNVGNILQGSGIIGSDGLSLVNQGTVNANASSSLVLNPGGFTNQGVLEATGVGMLQVSTSVSNAGGMIIANGGTAAVQFANGITIQGGTLNGINGGFVGSFSGNALNLDGTANAVSIAAGGTYTVGNNSTTNLFGTINNNGTLLLDSTGSNTTLNAASAGATLTGIGSVMMTSGPNMFLGTSLVNAGNIILDSATFNVSAYTQSAGRLQVSATGSASSVNVGLNGGTAQVDGTLATSQGVSVTGGGTLSGTGTILSNVSMAGVTEAGDIPNPGVLTIGINGVGSYTQSSAGAYDVVIGGLRAGSQYSQLNVPAPASLSGTLNVSLINGFIPAGGNQFVILTASSLNGQFVTTNLPPLPPNLSWMINYTSTQVVLSVMASSQTFTLTVTTLGTGNGTVTDNFEQIDCIDTAGVQSGTCSASYNAGTTVNLTATPSENTTFGGWGGACTGVEGCSVLMNSNQSVTAAFVPPPITMLAPFTCPGGIYPCQNVTAPPAVFNCPSGKNPCPDPNAHSLALTAAQVNSPFTMTVAANEVSMAQADGDCQFGQIPSTDFDCRFTSFFPFETLSNGDVIVPACDAYSNGNCVFYSVYFGTKGIEPPITDYDGPISWSIAWNNTSFLPNPNYPYQINNPRLYDDPDYEASIITPYGTDCTVPMLINGNPTDPPIFCQLVFDITTYFDPNQPPDAGIGGKTKQFNDVVVAFPLNNAAPDLSVTKTADQTQVNAGSPIGYTIVMSNSAAPGTGSATNTTLNDPLPAGAGVNWSISPPYAGPGTCAITGVSNAQTLTCNLGSLSPAIRTSVHVMSSNSSAGTYVNTATLAAQNNPAQMATATITVVGGSGPIATVRPSKVNFGKLYLGLPGVSFVTLSNTGNAPLIISSIKIATPGNDLDDFHARGFCPTSLAAGKSCKILLTCLSDSDNYSPTATLAITDNAPGSPQTVPLSATIINPRARVVPKSLNFGSQQVGTTSPPQTVTLTNTGTTSLLLWKLTISGNFAFASGTTCSNGTTLAPNAQCVMNVTFTPKGKGNRVGCVELHDNTLFRKQKVPLSGVGD